MDTEIYLYKLHKEILSIIDEVVRICDENDLKYYLIGGTLLGAVRHKGFIPWDDDLDIVMPREDFNKFISICNKEIKSSYKLEWITTKKNYGFMFAKVCKKETLFEERKGISFGIFIDIFPIDSTNGITNELKIRWKIIKKLKLIMYCKFAKCNLKGFNKIVVNLSNINIIQLLLIKLCSISSNKGKYFTNFGSQYGVIKQTMPKEYYGEGTILKFEDRFYRVPKKYDLVLKSIFGENYMDIPPENKRKTHLPSKVIFSDGTNINFK